MHHFFAEHSQNEEGRMILTGSDVNHIRQVLRMKAGDQIYITDAAGQEYFCEIEAFDPDKVKARILYQNRESRELPVKIWLFQGLPKGDKMELVIQKAVELGVYEIVPVAMRNCVVRLDQKRAAAKTARWQAIAESAAKQAKRGLIPRVHPPMEFADAAAYAKTLDVCLLPYENERGMERTRQVLGGLKRTGSLGIMIGPEGGFDPREIDLVQNEVHLLSLGNRILRTETAGFVMLSMLLYQLEE